MNKSLVVVESPAKAKTISKYLGAKYIVRSSVGHIRDLPKSSSKQTKKIIQDTKGLSDEEKLKIKKHKAKLQLIDKMGVDPENDWQARYEILSGKEKVVKELKQLAGSVKDVYLATDLDREGEAIAWHLQQVIGNESNQFHRVIFNEITKTAIQSAFEKPIDLNIDRVNAQQARRFLDRVVGFMVSPLLWSKIARGLSAGRVQSVAVRLIVEKEREIHQFIPEEFWEVYVDLKLLDDQLIRFQVVSDSDKVFRPSSELEVKKTTQRLVDAKFSLTKKEEKKTKSKPSAPFITSTLQQAASTRLGFSVKKTMTLAQRLYEAGHITYMRTDSTNLSGYAIESVRHFIKSEFGDKYLPEKPNVYSSKSVAQEAHEAIRPSNVVNHPSFIKGLEKDTHRLYDMIWRQFVACQMVAADYLSTKLITIVDDIKLQAKGRVLLFDGFTKVFTTKTDDVLFPVIAIGDKFKLTKIDPKQLFTKPPARFSEASLVRELEKQGIGRPSTYASIISTIQDRGYVKYEARRFYALKMGDIVTDRLIESFSNLMEYRFTADMENQLDLVAQGHQNWTDLLDLFYQDFSKKLEKAELEVGGMRVNQPTETDITCPTCQRPMMIRTASTGVFLGCSGYQLPIKDRCKSTLNLVASAEVQSISDDNAELNALRAMRRCAVCATAMDSFLVDESRKLHICGNNPDCEGFEVEFGQFKIKGYEGPTLDCDKCSSEMILKTGRFGKYFGCNNESCKNTRKLLKNGQAAPPKMDPVVMPELQCMKVDDHYVLRDGAAGLFLAASQFPKKRETRAPLVKEIVPHRQSLDPKYHYLLDAPQMDPEKNLAIIRFSRKTNQQYVMTEKNGKATGWSAEFKDGVWVEVIKVKKVKQEKK